LPADFIKGNSNATRAEAIRQYGQLNVKVANKDHTINTQARDAEFNKNPAKYSGLNSHPEQAKIPEEKQGADVRQPFTRQPVVTPQRQQSQRVQTQRTQPSAQPYNNIQRAQSYHTNTWQQAQPQYHSAPQYSAPARSMPSAPAGGGFHGGGGGGRR